MAGNSSIPTHINLLCYCQNRSNISILILKNGLSKWIIFSPNIPVLPSLNHTLKNCAGI